MKKEIISQYKASLKMLKDVIKKCPDDLWTDNKKYENAYWRIVYHTIYYAARYLDPDNFNHWSKHKVNYHRLGQHTDDNQPIFIDAVYSMDEMTEYLESVYSRCGILVNNTPMESESGFEWLPLNRGELHLYNIRHIQHHTGQLIERLHQAGIKGIEWESAGSE